ncbi:MAG: ATP-binding protein [Desulforhabdus sp.]|nr:ATP-binding protein [Desulforhabdus sp.]
MLGQLVKITGSKSGFVGIFDDMPGSFIFESAEGSCQEHKTSGANFRALVNGALCSRGSESLRNPVVLNNITPSKLAATGIAGPGDGLSNLLIIPLSDRSRAVAVAALANKDNPYSENDIQRVAFLLDGLWKAVRSRVQKATLGSSENMLQQVLNSIPGAMVIMDEEFRISMLNRAASYYFGLKDNAAVVGKRCFEGLMARTDACPDCTVLRHTSSDGAWTFERMGSNNSDRLERVSLHPIRGEQGQRLILMNIKDVTQTKHLDRLSSIGFDVVSIAHSITNPAGCIGLNLPVLQGYLERLFESLETAGMDALPTELYGMTYLGFRTDVFRLLDDLKHGSDKIKRISMDIKNFARSGELVQQPRLNEKWIDIKKLIDETLRLCSAELTTTRLKIHVCLPEKCLPVFTDADALSEILVNLLTNAAHARNKKDAWVKLNVSFRNSWQRYCLIEVRDNGCGIDESLKEKIFQPFFTTKDAFSGTGLGLHICQSLIRVLGGTIEVESTKNEETCFRVVLHDIERRKKPRLNTVRRNLRNVHLCRK